MIKLELKPYCQDCMMFESSDDVLCAGDKKYTTITCEHMDLCDRIEQYLKSVMEETER